ncbi:hypothetical protein WOLCODRAFT_166700 [Wolfiporia cocos MD-104 SS10]|uniref:RPA43 OB domain-containing protein n=1 Tax=Wolfiporia cocos (strain MD-104) TaxID=742152 RepID=A0A2H3JJF5_WOLCO|nr:hypothetical protein WOLCODRAFT_166700 [Wolfiporia cocos MD-104 SS10]
MSHTAQNHTKKRKHAAAESNLGVEPSTKRAKVKDKSGKGKGRATDNASEFRIIQAKMAVTIPPVFANNPRAGAEEMLDSLLMRYVPALGSVVLAHNNLQFLDNTATIKADCPFANCRIAFDATVWSPQVGMKLIGKVKLCSPDHIALLVHHTFNVSIPRHHIPIDNWEFEYGPAENDPEFGAEITGEDGQQADVASGIEGSGRWVHKLTGATLGGEDGYLEFTVVGMTVANQMLSLLGSIQPDPFSMEHVPTTASSIHAPRSITKQTAPTEELLELGIDEGDDSNDEDPFDERSSVEEEATSAKIERTSGDKEAETKRKWKVARPHADENGDGEEGTKVRKKK